MRCEKNRPEDARIQPPHASASSLLSWFSRGCLSFLRKRPLLSGVLFLGAAGLAGASLLLPDPPLESVTRWPSSFVLLDDREEAVHIRLSSRNEWNIPVSLEKMGQWLPLVAVAVEDRRFHSHHGIDIAALARALWQNLTRGKTVSGASTITSQLIRIAIPRKRTLLTKIMEFAQAVTLESRLNKEKILEIYLNRAPFGGAIRGVEAASLFYFGKHARDVSLGEAAMLIAMLKGPSLYRPDRNPALLRKRRDAIIDRLLSDGRVTRELALLARQEPMPGGKKAFPARAWHYAELAFRELDAGGGAVASPLDSALQWQLEHILKAALQKGRPGLTAAAAIMDAKTGDLLAYVGNARLDISRDTAWVDCGSAPRSPGSALKPFAYLLAFEQGRLLPASMLADSPLSFGGGAPRNFDRHYRGPVSAAVALADSLNAPAVRVARLTGHASLLAFLHRLGFSGLQRDSAHYGDSLILGGGEVTLLQLVRAYGALASLGSLRPLRLDRAAPPGPPERISRSDTTFLIAEILKDPARLSLLDARALSDAGTPVAFKTGTSYGFRDAWAIGYTPDYVAGVWFGHEDGSPDPALVGQSISVPPLMRIFRALFSTRPQGGRWYSEPLGIRYASVCALSGHVPNRACPSTRIAPTLPDIAPLPVCRLHAYRQGRPAVLWTKELEGFSTPENPSEPDGRKPVIAVPAPGTRFLLTPGASRQRIRLRCEGAAYPVHWYADNAYIGTQKETDAFFWDIRPGKHTISLMDATGRASATHISVTDLGRALAPPPPVE